MKVIDKYNTLTGAAVTILTALFGVYWYIFAAYLLLNVIDWLTGWYKSHRNRTESSAAGLKGIIKKLGYWGIITVAFIMSSVITRLGTDVLQINLGFLALFGWLTVAMLLVNEARSILENLVECGYHVPDFLIRGLAVTERLINSKSEEGNE